jgi:hypothetical protein
MITPILEARANPNLRRAFTTSPSGALPAIACASTQPTGAGVLVNPIVTGWANRWLKLLPFGTGADNDTYTLQVLGWGCIDNLWVPTILFQATCTLSTFVGLSGQPVTNSERFADTIGTPAKGTAGVDCIIISTADNTPSSVLIDCKGSQLVEVRVGGTANGNALYAWV